MREKAPTAEEVAESTGADIDLIRRARKAAADLASAPDTETGEESEDTHTIYRCSECGITGREVSARSLDQHIVWEHAPDGNPYTKLTDDEQAYIDEVKQRVELPDSVLREHVVEDGEER